MHQRHYHLQRMEHFLRGHLAQKMNSSGTNGAAELTGRPSLTISRQCGSRCDRIRKSLIEYLESVDESTVHGWACFDQSMIGKLIEEGTLRDHVVHFDPEEARIPVSPNLENRLQLPKNQWTLFNHSASVIRSLCHIGNAIILGRAGNFITADLPNTFHVRLIGSEDIRRQYTRERYQLGEAAARTLLEQTDQSRANFVKRYADADIEDSSHYHLVINTDQLSDETLVRIIADSVIEWAEKLYLDQQKVTPMSLHR